MLKQSFDDRRDLFIGATYKETIDFAAIHWIKTAKKAIETRDKFAVALSGGSTPNAIYQLLASPSYSTQLNWSKVWFFWSDERAVPPSHRDSNFHAAMNSGLANLPLVKNQIFRMEGERKNLKEAASDYEKLIQKHLGSSFFDLVMLGIGEDGHTASLFPETEALTIEDKLVAANWVSQKNSWRITLTYPCIEKSAAVVIYALGFPKKKIIQDVLFSPVISPFPASRLGQIGKKALWILDQEAAALIA